MLVFVFCSLRAMFGEDVMKNGIYRSSSREEYLDKLKIIFGTYIYLRIELVILYIVMLRFVIIKQFFFHLDYIEFLKAPIILSTCLCVSDDDECELLSQFDLDSLLGKDTVKTS